MLRYLQTIFLVNTRKKYYIKGFPIKKVFKSTFHLIIAWHENYIDD